MAITSERPGTPSKLRARAGAAVTARLDADPSMRRVPTDAAAIWRCPGFLDAATCDALIALIDADRRPSTLLTGRDEAAFRTSESCDMDRASPAIRPTDERLAATLGLPIDTGETMQGQRYAPGQHFRAHHDYFGENESYWPRMRASGGQRIWTAMVYLNDVEEGGATWFPQAGVRVRPARGLLLVWNNMAADGSPEPRTLHEGMPVVAGVKYIVTKWFREVAWGSR